MTSDAPIRVGLVGCGAISTQHLEAIAAVDGLSLAAVMSASADRARTAGERWGVPWTTSLDELLARDDVDAVTVCSPSGHHPGQALAALRSGRHAIVEKPTETSIQFKTSCPEKTEQLGRMHVIGSSLYILTLKFPTGTSGVEIDPFVYSFEARK